MKKQRWRFICGQRTNITACSVIVKESFYSGIFTGHGQTSPPAAPVNLSPPNPHRDHASHFFSLSSHLAEQPHAPPWLCTRRPCSWEEAVRPWPVLRPTPRLAAGRRPACRAHREAAPAARALADCSGQIQRFTWVCRLQADMGEQLQLMPSP